MDELQFERRLTEWLEDGPAHAQESTLGAVLAYAHQHPRGRAMRLLRRDAMKTSVLGHPGVPVPRLVAILAVIALCIALSGLVLVGPFRMVVGPASTPTGQESSTPWWLSAATPEDVIDSSIDAWRTGYLAAKPMLYADEAVMHVITDHSTMASGDPFRITSPSPWPWFQWRRTGAIFGQDPYRAHPTTFHGWEPPIEGFAVYRFGGDGRVEVEWIIAFKAPQSGDGNREAVPAPSDVIRLLDGCLDIVASRDRATIQACYAPTAVTRSSYGSPDGSWTTEAIGIAAIEDAVHQAAERFPLQRSGAMVMQGDFVAYPVRSSREGHDPTGIEVIRLDPAHTRIVDRWTVAGP